jgi:predicted glycosyltransferase
LSRQPGVKPIVATGGGLVSWAKHLELPTLELPGYRTRLIDDQVHTVMLDPSLTFSEGRAARMHKLAECIETAAPVTMVVDFRPKGKKHELDQLIKNYRKSGHIRRLVLGLRPVVGKWKSTGACVINDQEWQFFEDWYDECWIFGSESVYGAHLPGHLQATSISVTFVGYPPTPKIDSTPASGAGGKVHILLNAGSQGIAEPGLESALRRILREERGNCISLALFGTEPREGQEGCEATGLFESYLTALGSAFACVSHAGCNALLECVEVSVPCLAIVRRDLLDDEQDVHLGALAARGMVLEVQGGRNLLVQLRRCLLRIHEGWRPPPVPEGMFMRTSPLAAGRMEMGLRK